MLAFLKSCSATARRLKKLLQKYLYRIILQENEILFACNRRLKEQVQQISRQTAEFTVLGKNIAEIL